MYLSNWGFGEWFQSSTTLRTQPHHTAPDDASNPVPSIAQQIPSTRLPISFQAKILLALIPALSTTDNIPIDLLIRGASPRKRWGPDGQIEEIDATHAGLAPEVVSFLSDPQRLRPVLNEVSRLSVKEQWPGILVADKPAFDNVWEKLSANQRIFWSRQALILCYRVIPWSYLEAAPRNIGFILPHLARALSSCHTYLDSFPESIRAEMVVSLTEAARLSDGTWRQFLLTWAGTIARGLDKEKWPLTTSLTLWNDGVSPFPDNMDRRPPIILLHSSLDQPSTMEPWARAIVGDEAVQRALALFDAGDVSAARELLENLEVIDLSPIKQIVLFHKSIILGEVLRVQGNFKGALSQLEAARTIADHPKNLIFDDFRHDLIFSLANTLLELNEPATAGRHLRAELARIEQKADLPVETRGFTDDVHLLIALREVLFAQDRLDEALQVRNDLQGHLPWKSTRLALDITDAKIRHVKGEYSSALYYWQNAMMYIEGFPKDRWAARVIALSICDCLVGMGQTWLKGEARRQLDELEGLVDTEGGSYWVVGLRRWVVFLKGRMKEEDAS